MSTNSGKSHVPNFAISDHAERAIFGLEPAPEERTLVDILTATINAHPDIAAIEAENGIITYGELLDVLNAQVERLQEHGVGTGSRVGIRVPSGTTDLYVAILATIYAGAAYVPVDWDELDTRADTVWEEANVDAVFGKDLSITHPRHIPEFEACITAVCNWSEYILNSFDVQYSNGFTEGCNNAIKTLKRLAFGFRSFNTFRVRILLASRARPYI